MSMRYILIAVTCLGLAASAHPVIGICIGVALFTTIMAFFIKEEKRIANISRNYKITTLNIAKHRNENLRNM